MADINDYYSVLEGLRNEIEQTKALTSEEKDMIMSCGYGHISEGDIQISLGVKKDDYEVATNVRERAASVADQFLVDYVTSRKGSISGEHGVGRQRVNALQKSKGEAFVRTMHIVKNAFDPNGILNPGKVLPPKE